MSIIHTKYEYNIRTPLHVYTMSIQPMRFVNRDK